MVWHAKYALRKKLFKAAQTTSRILRSPSQANILRMRQYVFLIDNHTIVKLVINYNYPTF